jgi:hypothetical protein
VKATGTWRGEYTYGDLYEHIAGSSVPFTMSLTESWPGRIAGYVRDDASKGGMPERGRIAGSRRGATLTFVKTMPVGYVSDETGQMVETRTWLSRVFGLDKPAVSPHRIHYTGEMDAIGHSITGTWAIELQVVAEDDEGVHTVGGQGTWTARRVSDQPNEV